MINHQNLLGQSSWRRVAAENDSVLNNSVGDTMNKTYARPRWCCCRVRLQIGIVGNWCVEHFCREWAVINAGLGTAGETRAACFSGLSGMFWNFDKRKMCWCCSWETCSHESQFLRFHRVKEAVGRNQPVSARFTINVWAETVSDQILEAGTIIMHTDQYFSFFHPCDCVIITK